MKVQVKVTGNPRIKNQYNVEDVGERYYVIADEHGMLVVVAKKDYEPVEEWVDVTHTVKFGTYSGLMDYRDKDHIVDSEMNGVGYILAGKDGVSITMKGVWQEEFKMEMVNGAIRVYERKGA